MSDRLYKCLLGLLLAAAITAAAYFIWDWIDLQSWCHDHGGQTVGGRRDVCVDPEGKVLLR